MTQQILLGFETESKEEVAKVDKEETKTRNLRKQEENKRYDFDSISEKQIIKQFIFILNVFNF